MAVLDAASPALERVRRHLSTRSHGASWRLSASWVGPLATLAVALVLELLRGRGVRLPDPAPVLLLPVVATAVAAGVRAALVASAIAVIACLIAFAGPPFVSQPGNALRVLVLAGMFPSVAALVGRAHDRKQAEHAELAARRAFEDRLNTYLSVLVREPVDGIYTAIVDAVPALVACDLVALTLADPRDSRHYVRAVHGADPSVVGVEIVPGVGVAGQAILSRDVVVAERLRPAAAAVSDAPPSSTVAGAPVIAGGRVIATLTMGRTLQVHPFTAIEREQMSLLAGATALILRDAELRVELAESALRDPLTGLYNRTYLDAALDQLLALRRRMKPDDRRPMAVVLFDVDDFRRFNEQHGRAAGDRVLQAIGGVLRRRFRESDTMARVAGDGFLVVMDGAGKEAAARAASEVRAMVRALELVTARGAPVRVSVSAGCATFEDADPGAQAVIRTAEAALDTARWSARDAIVAI